MTRNWRWNNFAAMKEFIGAVIRPIVVSDRWLQGTRFCFTPFPKPQQQRTSLLCRYREGHVFLTNKAFYNVNCGIAV